MRILLFPRVVAISSFIALCMISSATVLAQGSFRDRGSGFIYYGTAAAMDSGSIGYPVGIGAGGQVFLIRGLAAGADFGYYANPGYSDVDFRLFSANLGYHFKSRRVFHRIDPFVVGGWGLFNDRSNVSLGFGGAGLDAWFRKKIGLRFEGRMYAAGQCGCGLMTLRVGLLLR
jgi:hypothetical protein